MLLPSSTDWSIWRISEGIRHWRRRGWRIFKKSGRVAGWSAGGRRRGRKNGRSHIALDIVIKLIGQIGLSSKHWINTVKLVITTP